MVNALSVRVAILKPLDFRLYPLERVATLNSSCSKRTKYSICGVLPVPPTLKLPTQMVLILGLNEYNNRLSKHQLRRCKINP